MKYSLRSLMIVVTVTAVPLGAVAARREYLRQRSFYHEREAARLVLRPDGQSEYQDELDIVWIEYHRKLGEEYRRAVSCPWITIDESNRPPGKYGTATMRRPSGEVIDLRRPPQIRQQNTC